MKAPLKQLQEVYGSAPVAMILRADDGTAIWCNARAVDLFECDSEDHQSRSRPLTEMIDDLFEEGRDPHEPLWGHRPDGSRFPIEVGVCPLETSDAGHVHLLTITDVSQWREAEERLRWVFRAAPTAMMMVGPDGRINLTNDHLDALFGYERNELIGAPIEALVPRPTQGKHVALRDGFMDRPSPRKMGQSRDLRALRKDGSTFPVEVGLSSIQGREGVLTITTVIDLSMRKGETEKLQREASATEEEKSALQASLRAARDGLDSPLKAIDGILASAESAAATAPETSRVYLTSLREHLSKMEKIIEGLQDK